MFELRMKEGNQVIKLDYKIKNLYVNTTFRRNFQCLLINDNPNLYCIIRPHLLYQYFIETF